MPNERGGANLVSARMLFDGATTLGLADEELLERYLEAQPETAEAAFEVLVQRHGPMVLRVCRGTLHDAQDAQDAFQATFLVLARRAGWIRQRRSLASWLYGVARKIALRTRSDSARRRLREQRAAVNVIAGPDMGWEPDDFAALFEEIDRLPAAYRQPIILCYLDGMTYEAAASHLDCPLGTLSIRLKRARERLRSRLTRRGVAVPAGLLVVGVSPSLAPAAVPGLLVTLAMRSAMSTVLRKSFAGAVPAAVASMAERMMVTMRIKAMVLGMVALGGVVVATTASVAMKPTGAVPIPVQQPAPAPEPRSRGVRFPNGTTVELVGISTHPSHPRSWRTPAGDPLSPPPYDHAPYRVATTEGRRIWEVAYRVQDQPGAGETLQVQTEPKVSSNSSGRGFDAIGLPIPGMNTQSFDFAQDQATCAIRFGLAAGPWKVEASSRGLDLTGIGREKGSVIFSKALEVGARTTITVSEGDAAEEERRVVAVDRQGREHGPGQSQAVAVKDFTQRELIYDLPLAAIKEFQLQSRPYEWATLEDVALKPRGAAGKAPDEDGPGRPPGPPR